MLKGHSRNNLDESDNEDLEAYSAFVGVLIIVDITKIGPI